MRAAYIPLPAILNSGVLDCLPLHVRDGIGLAVAERVNVILHPLRTGTPRKPADCEALSREGWNSIDLTFVTVLHDDVIELRLAGQARQLIRLDFPSTRPLLMSLAEAPCYPCMSCSGHPPET